MQIAKCIVGVTMAIAVQGCARAATIRDYGHGYTIRSEKDPSPRSYTGERQVLLYGGQIVTDQSFQQSPSARFVFYAAYGNWYLFDSTTGRSRFLRSAPFTCSAKFYETATPPVLRCFDVFNDKVVEVPLE